MDNHQWHCIRILTLNVLSATLWAYVQTEPLCIRGLKTPGYTTPHGEIFVEYGNPLDITCVLYEKYMLEHNNISSKNLYFTKEKGIIPNEQIQVINSSSIRLRIDKPLPSSEVYRCRVANDPNAVCLNVVTVGTRPSPIDDFRCISYNYENLTCLWTPKQNSAKTYYNLRYNFPGRAKRVLSNTCPNMISLNTGEMKCVWTILSSPPYRQAQRTYYFQLNATNIFGTYVLNKTFSHFQNVLSNPPENLTVLNTTSQSVFLHWSPTYQMQAFPPGLQHRITYRLRYGENYWRFGGLLTTDTGDEMGNIYYNLTGLKYANAEYEVKISMRSNAAKPEDETMWSKNSSIIVKTMGKEPGAPPETNVGSFEIIPNHNENLDYYDIYVYWKEILKELKNGEGFSYNAAVQEGARIIKPVEIGNLYARFNNLSNKESYIFRIWSQNNFGRSKYESTIFVPKQSERIGGPLDFTKICFCNGKYELTWKSPKSPLINYTIFQCVHDKERSSHCSGNFTWIEVRNDTITHTVTVFENKPHQFAISANTKTSSSGIVWPSIKIVAFWVSQADSTFLEVHWQMDCSENVEGFTIYYCIIDNPNTSCKEPERKLVLHEGSTTDRANITGLKPYSVYRLAITVDIKQQVQKVKSNYLFATTLRAATK